MQSDCQTVWDCQLCSRAVENPITHVFHPKGFHLPTLKCDYNFIVFMMAGEAMIHSSEYANTTVRSGEFILQSFGSKFELVALTECECIYYKFNELDLFCDDRFKHILANEPIPKSYAPIKIAADLQYFIDGSKAYMMEKRVCKDLLLLKRKELAFVLGYCYTDKELACLVHLLSKYITTFEYFILRNYQKVKTVEELALLGGYTVSTFRRIFNQVFHEPVYEWMLARRKENIWDELKNTNSSISEICYKYGFESLAHFSNFCKKNFGSSPRILRKIEKAV